MTSIDPAARLTHTYTTGDLAEFADGPGPFATVLIPSPSDRADSGHTLDVRWRNARRELQDQWPAERLAQLDELFDDLDHGDAAAYVVIQRADGAVLVEGLTTGLDAPAVQVSDHPRLLEVIEHRQRTLPHIVVETDRAGASISVFAAGAAAASETVDGDTLHIHRGRGGGWSHRRFQQRAENTWERNADDVGEVVRELADGHDPVMIAIAGEVRATQLLHEALDDRFGDILVDIEAGDPDGIADEVLTALDDRHARFQVAIIQRLRDEQGLTDPDEVTEALREGRVETLLVAGPSNASADDALDRHAAISEAIDGALRTSASVVVVPTTAETSGGVAALTRW